MDATDLYRRIVSGESGVWAAPMRGLLRLAEIAYATGVSIRNARYDRPGSTHRAGVPVISVGNITVGGTGKTPFVIEIAKRLDRMGRSPAVIARGYGALPGDPNDEELLIRKHCPGAAYVAEGDRVRAAERAVSQLGADVVLLDDGFQHRRLARDLDLVLIDATCPFGFEHVLPRGLLREPLSGLRRADLVVVTRSDQVSTNQLERTEGRLRELAPDAPLIRACHRVMAIEGLDGSPIDRKAVGKAVLFAAVARPQSFATTVASLGIEVVGTRWWPDHHPYRAREIEALIADKRWPARDLLLTTEKDGVKLACLPGIDRAAIGVVRVAIAFPDDGDKMLQDALDRALNHNPQMIPKDMG